MMAMMGLMSGGAAASGAAATAAAGGAAATAAGGFSLSQILGGGATLLSSVASIAAGKADAEAYEMKASDEQINKQTDLLEGIQRKSDAKRAMTQAVADIDTSTAAGGGDLTFGSAAEAKRRAYREGDLIQNSNTNATGSTLDQRNARTRSFIRMAGRARQSGLIEGITTGVTGFAKLAETRKSL